MRFEGSTSSHRAPSTSPVLAVFQPAWFSAMYSSAVDEPGRMGFWRREWDSNPRYGFPYTRFPSERLQPLGHPSARGRNIVEVGGVTTRAGGLISAARAVHDRV
jgi:hypothetical protein